MSHDLAVVQQVTDDAIVMHRGVVVERGTTDAVLSSPSAAYTQRLLDAVPRPGWKPTRHSQLERPLTRLLPMPERSRSKSSDQAPEAEPPTPIASEE